MMKHQPIRVLHVITGLSTGGAETMLLKILTGMSKSGFIHRVISLTGRGEVGPLIEKMGIPVIALNMPRGVPSPAIIFRLIGEVRRYRPDIVQTWLYHSDLAGLIAAKVTGIKHVLWNIRCSFMGEDYYRGASGFVIKALGYLSRFPSTIIVNSRAGRDLHIKLGYKTRHWEIIGNGFDLERFRPDPQFRNRLREALGVDQNTFLIGLIARWDPIKGHDVFFKAAQILEADGVSVHFVLVGEGCSDGNPDIEALIPDNLKASVHLLGRREDIPEINAALDVACCTSYGEGFSNTIGEAMACAVPCTVTDVGDSAEIVANTGFVVPSGDADRMAEAWAKLLAMPLEERHSLGESARKRIKENYSLEYVTTAYEELYSSLVDG
jgi:glycosyltransferase involved in cell wall biosynthesis